MSIVGTKSTSKDSVGQLQPQLWNVFCFASQFRAILKIILGLLCGNMFSEQYSESLSKLISRLDWECGRLRVTSQRSLIALHKSTRLHTTPERHNNPPKTSRK